MDGWNEWIDGYMEQNKDATDEKMNKLVRNKRTPQTIHFKILNH